MASNVSIPMFRMSHSSSIQTHKRTLFTMLGPYRDLNSEGYREYAQ